MAEALRNPHERAVAFRAITGGESWFERFASSFLAEAMSEGGQAADWTISALSSAWTRAPATVEKLLSQRWHPDPANDFPDTGR